MGPGHCACCQLMETWACLPPRSLPPPHLPPSPLLPAHTASLFILCRPPSSPARNRFLSLSPGPVQELEQNVPVSWASCLPWACREGPSLAEGPEPRRPSGFGSSQTQGPGRSSGRSCPGASEAAAPRPASPLSRRCCQRPCRTLIGMWGGKNQTHTLRPSLWSNSHPSGNVSFSNRSVPTWAQRQRDRKPTQE